MKEDFGWTLRMGENWLDEKRGVGRKVTGSSAPVQGESLACWGVIWGLGWVQRRGRTDDGVDGWRMVWTDGRYGWRARISG